MSNFVFAAGSPHMLSYCISISCSSRNLQCFDHTLATLSLKYLPFSLYCEQGMEETYGLGAEGLRNSNEFYFCLFCWGFFLGDLKQRGSLQ